MAKTVQKRIKFSKGQIAPELIERTDLDLYNSSAQELKNVVSTIYGGIRSRRGTTKIDKVLVGEVVTPESTSSTYFSDTDFSEDTVKTSVALNSADMNYNHLAEFDFGEDGATGMSITGASISDETILDLHTGTNNFNYDGKYRICMCGSCGASQMYKYDVRIVDQPGDPAIIKTNIKGATGGGGGAVSCILNARTSLDSYIVEFLTQQETRGGGGGLPTVTLEPGVYLTKQGSMYLSGSYFLYCGNGTNATASSSDLLNGEPGENDVDLSSAREGEFEQIEVNGVSDGYGHTKEFNDVQSTDRIYVERASSLLDKYGVRFTSYPIDAIVSDIETGTTTGNISSMKFMLKPEMDMEIRVYGNNTSQSHAGELLAIATVNTSSKDISLSWDGNYRYINVCFGSGDEHTHPNYPFKVQVRKIQGVNNTSSQLFGKMYPFIYNNKQKYLFLFSSGFLKIYKDGEVIQNIYYEDITDDMLKELKIAYKDDTVILTHPELRTKQLQRQTDGTWIMSDFQFKNIPVYAFGGETETNYSYRIAPSAVEGNVKISVLDGHNVFTEDSVGQLIDFGGGRARINEYIDARNVMANTIIPFYTTDTVYKFTVISGYEPVWSETRGYPSTCLFAQQRLWFGGSKMLPAHIWASRIDDYNNFKNSGNYDNDAIDVTMLTNERIINLVECRGIHVLTSGDEWTAPETSLTPDAFSLTKNTSNGSFPGLDAIVLSGTVCYVEKNGRSLLSYVYNYEQANYQSDNLSIMTNLIEAPVRIGCVVNSSVDKGDFLFVVKNDGTMLITCISIPQHIFSVSQYQTEGSIKDVCVLGEDIYLIVKRSTDVYLEKVSDEKVDLTESITIGAGPGMPQTSEAAFFGKEVYLYNDTQAQGPCKVSVLGAISTTLTNGTFKIGLPYDFEIESNPININGKTTSVKKRISKATLTCKDTQRLEFCGQKKYEKSGLFDFYSCTKYGNDVRFNIKGTFYPINILSVLLNINYEGGDGING